MRRSSGGNSSLRGAVAARRRQRRRHHCFEEELRREADEKGQKRREMSAVLAVPRDHRTPAQDSTVQAPCFEVSWRSAEAPFPAGEEEEEEEEEEDEEEEASEGFPFTRFASLEIWTFFLQQPCSVSGCSLRCTRYSARCFFRQRKHVHASVLEVSTLFRTWKLDIFLRALFLAVRLVCVSLEEYKRSDIWNYFRILGFLVRQWSHEHASVRVARGVSCHFQRAGGPWIRCLDSIGR